MTIQHETFTGEEDWTKPVEDRQTRKRPISIRLDADVLDHFAAAGPGWQTRINAVLRAYVAAQHKQRDAAP